MEVVKTKSRLQQLLINRGGNPSVGFVPTMGALHKGHLSLVEAASEENDVVVVSIFVNPTQFNDKKDLERYPRDLDSDLKLLKTVKCDIVFSPEADEMYPEPDNRIFDFGHLEKVMEGKHRPGHFNGVAQIVSKLFDAVKSSKAYFGLKDFQQLAVIKALVKKMKLEVEIVPCPIIREFDGLAMSSRNRLLTVDQRNEAALIFATLNKARNLIHHKNVQELTEWVTETINKSSMLDVEYFEIVDNENLLPVNNWDEPSTKVGCIAVFCGGVRLIDNIVF
ncbi:MAG: pantoate--beta-alanine ligase [Prolixibacteraceae bacterium]|nr:pantoate--beta-alanine ligase [Prolixibacteraceae bacterium]